MTTPLQHLQQFRQRDTVGRGDFDIVPVVNQVLSCPVGLHVLDLSNFLTAPHRGVALGPSHRDQYLHQAGRV